MRSPERTGGERARAAAWVAGRAWGLATWLPAPVAALAAWLAAPLAALAASPTPEAAGDPRSSGQGPGLVGDPLMAIGIVVTIGVATLVCTFAYVRLTAARKEPRDRA